MKAYIYPITGRFKEGIYNPYLNNFADSLDHRIDFLNVKTPSNTGILDLMRYIWKIDLLFINWLENLPDKKAGMFQWYIFLIIMRPLLRLRKVRIIWTLHNKLPHDKKNLSFKMRIFNQLFSISDIIITHASEGLELISNRKHPDKAFFFPHPFNKRNRNYSHIKDIDILIWGSIHPYKGIDKFLELVRKNEYLKSLRIVISGKVIEPGYQSQISNLLSDNIVFSDKFMDDQELDDTLSRSRITLFTYHSDSILSSGALSDSLGYGNVVLGPHTGAFKDMQNEKLIYTYRSIEEIPDTCRMILTNFGTIENDFRRVSKYIEDHSWNSFAQTICKKFYA